MLSLADDAKAYFGSPSPGQMTGGGIVGEPQGSSLSRPRPLLATAGTFDALPSVRPAPGLVNGGPVVAAGAIALAGILFEPIAYEHVRSTSQLYKTSCDLPMRSSLSA